MDFSKDFPHQLQYYNAQSHNIALVSQGRYYCSQIASWVVGSSTESHAHAYELEELGSVPPLPKSRSSSPLSFYTANTSPSCPPVLSWYPVKPELYAWSFSASQQEGLRKAPSLPTNPSPLSFYTAKTSASDFSARYTTTSSTSMSSRVSFPYSVTSVNSYKSRKTVSYRRRAHPVPAMVVMSHVSPEYVVSLEVRKSF